MVSYCTLSNDRLLTKRLIETSNRSSQILHHHFVNTSEWTDGLDHWSSLQINDKTHFSRHNLDFKPHLGLYLPRQNKLKSAPILLKNDFISSTSITNTLFPKRLRQLFKKEKELLNGNELDTSSLDEPPITSETSNDISRCNSNRIKSSRVRLPLRHVQSGHYTRDNKSEQPHQDKIKLLLKTQLNQLFNRETINLNCRGTVIRTSSLEIKRQHKSIGDSSSIIERYTKLRHVLMTPPVDEVPINSKSFDNRQSPLLFRGLSTLGLTVTPLGFSSSKNLQNCASETTSQQEHKSISRCNSNHEIDVQRTALKRHLEKGLDGFSNKNSLDDQAQVLKNFHRHHRSTSRTAVHRTKISELLPTITPEKCFLIPISNHRNS